MTDALAFNRDDDETYFVLAKDANDDEIDPALMDNIAAALWVGHRARPDLALPQVVVEDGIIRITLTRVETKKLPLGRIPWIKLTFDTPDGERKSARIDLIGHLPA